MLDGLEKGYRKSLLDFFGRFLANFQDGFRNRHQNAATKGGIPRFKSVSFVGAAAGTAACDRLSLRHRSGKGAGGKVQPGDSNDRFE